MERTNTELVSLYIDNLTITQNEQSCLILGVINSCREVDELIEIKNIIEKSNIYNKDRLIESLCICLLII